jgi:3-deoxy-D-manno-octulosonate 8-phosphate phosphatase (KDO 8-P phosphatase)
MDGIVDLNAIASRIKLLLMDVDGVLTDGTIFTFPGPDGQMAETKGFNAQDGLALQWLYQKGIKTGVISGRKSCAVELRAQQTHMAYVYQGHLEKIPILEEILADSKLDPSEVAFVGDDLTDIVVMRRVGLGIAPANARAEVKQVAQFVTSAPGGYGAVREAGELILKAKGIWPEILKHYEVE